LGSRINFKHRHSFADKEVEPMIHRVLVPTDFSKRSERALRFARESFPNSQIHVIYALDWADREFGITQACIEIQSEGAAVLPEERELIKRFDSDLRDRLERFVRNATCADQVTSSYLFGDVVTVILETAQRWQADLICMATHDYRGLERMIFGSVAEAVMQRAKIPVLIEKEFEATSTGAKIRLARRLNREAREMSLS
jgi:nucleotide-binding universal stress UspA family protein